MCGDDFGVQESTEVGGNDLMINGFSYLAKIYSGVNEVLLFPQLLTKVIPFFVYFITFSISSDQLRWHFKENFPHKVKVDVRCSLHILSGGLIIEASQESH